MKIRFLIAGLLVLACAGQASANGIDPQVIFKPGTGSIPVGLNFTIPTLVAGSGNDVFINASGKTLYSLTLFLTPGPPAGSAYSCGLLPFSTGSSPQYFTDCYFKQAGPTGVTVVFDGGSGIPPSTPGHVIEFALGFNGWPAGANFTGMGNPVPEPATMSFLLLGMGALAVKRRFLRG